MEESHLESGNINAKWLDNIFENIKKIEAYEELARDGCKDVLDYMQIPYEHRSKVIGEIQYINMKKILTQIYLLLKDISPTKKIGEEKMKEWFKTLRKLRTLLDRRELFIDEPRNPDKTIKYSAPTPFFWQTLDFFSELDIYIKNKISDILYVSTENKPSTW